MNNAGYSDVRGALADRLARSTGLAYTANHILMTVGSSGAINTVLKAMLDPGDEVMVLAPSFRSIASISRTMRGRVVEVETAPDFQPDIARIEEALTPRTRAIILNSPNNPTGAVYSSEALHDLEAMLSRVPDPPVVISDEPYRAIVFDGIEVPETSFDHSPVYHRTSWSKAWAISGERIGYLAISPLSPSRGLRNACTFTNRILGYINAPAIWQRVVLRAADAVPEVAEYQRRRDRDVRHAATHWLPVRRFRGAPFTFFPNHPFPTTSHLFTISCKRASWPYPVQVSAAPDTSGWHSPPLAQ